MLFMNPLACWAGVTITNTGSASEGVVGPRQGRRIALDDFHAALLHGFAIALLCQLNHVPTVVNRRRPGHGCQRPAQQGAAPLCQLKIDIVRLQVQALKRQLAHLLNPCQASVNEPPEPS